ncbi:MAG: hypothetical protein AAFV72_12595 [Cyanobacteria bacterium J06635_1]
MVAQVESPIKVEVSRARKCQRLVATTYDNNIASDYTEKIEALNRQFRYANNNAHYWSDPGQSVTYGTPLYDSATSAQRLALNHLHWFANYNYISDSESETVAFNQITGSVFKSIGGYETLAEELTVETEQEYQHINAFRKIGLMTATSVIGKSGLNALLKWNSYKLKLGQDKVPTYQYYALRAIAKRMSRDTRAHYSDYLNQAEAQSPFILQAPTTGMLGRSLEFSVPLQSFFSFSWGAGSPFMACQFYTIRMIANLYLKNMEHGIAKYYKTLENTGEFIPAPTAVSRYHFLDEAFHTTISQLLAKDLYREFDKPTAYERFVANISLYMMQRGTLGGLSGVLPHRYFADDGTIMEVLYRLLQGPVFGMAADEALHWMQLCLCQEHDGFHLARSNRNRLLGELRRFFQPVEYLWPINRDMQVMAKRGSIDAALRQNKITFDQFSRSVAA